MVWKLIDSAPRDEAILIAGGDILYPVTASWSGDLNFPVATPLPESSDA